MSDEPRRRQDAFLALVVVLTLLHWTVLVLRLPIFEGLPRWFWDFTDKPAGSPLTLVALVAGPLVVLSVIFRTPGRPRLHVGLVFGLGLLLQFALALTEGRGIDALRDRMVTTGHSEFAEQAVRVESLRHLVSDYERRAEGGELGRYAPSKPPGQLLLYVATERLASAAAPAAGRGARLRRLRAFASYAWPVASLLVLVPLYRLGRLLADEKTAVLACLLYVFVPAVDLITLHTDPGLFPPVLHAAPGPRRRSRAPRKLLARRRRRGRRLSFALRLLRTRAGRAAGGRGSPVEVLLGTTRMIWSLIAAPPPRN